VCILEERWKCDSILGKAGLRLYERFAYFLGALEDER
jgi:hypothetical protein